MRYFPDFYPIPKDFWCFETGDLFRRCAMCDRDLMVDGTNYLIERAFRKKEPIFEYAMCINCYQELQNTLSINSRKLINHYFEEHIDIEKRRSELISKYGRRTKSWINRCMIKGTPMSKCEEYQLYAWCIDKDIVFTGMPYMLSGEVIDEILNLLSAETTGVIDELTDQLFGIGRPKGIALI